MNEYNYFVSFYGGYPECMANFHDTVVKWNGAELEDLKRKVRIEYDKMIGRDSASDEEIVLSIISFKKLAPSMQELERKDNILCSTLKCILNKDLMKDCPEKEYLKKLAADTEWFK